MNLQRENDFSDHLGGCFGLPRALHVGLAPVGGARFSATRLLGHASHAQSRLVAIPPLDAYLLTLYLADTEHCDVGPDGRETEIRRYRRGSMCLIDLAGGASIRLFRPIDAICFYMPRALFDEIGQRFETPLPAGLRCLRGIPDRVVWNIGNALCSEIERPESEHDGKAGLKPPNLQMIGHVAIAVCSHLMQTYAAQGEADGTPPEYLGPFQEKAVVEYLADHFAEAVASPDLAGDLAADLAALCDLSRDHFLHRFRNTTGHTLERWMEDFRLDQAREILARGGGAVSEVIRACGLKDEARIREALAMAHPGFGWPTLN